MHINCVVQCLAVVFHFNKTNSKVIKGEALTCPWGVVSWKDDDAVMMKLFWFAGWFEKSDL